MFFLFVSGFVWAVRLNRALFLKYHRLLGVICKLKFSEVQGFRIFVGAMCDEDLCLRLVDDHIPGTVGLGAGVLSLCGVLRLLESYQKDF